MMGRLLCLVLSLAAAGATMLPWPAHAAGDNWYQIESTERLVDFDPQPVENLEPYVENWLNDWVRGRMTVVHYGSFSDAEINASVVLFAFGSGRLQYYSARDNFDFYLSVWDVGYRDLSEFRALDGSLGEFDYATFVSISDGIEKSCLNFTRRFNQRKELTGYYCRADTKPLSDDEIQQVIASVVLNDG